jgi:hypothetical protein
MLLISFVCICAGSAMQEFTSRSEVSPLPAAARDDALEIVQHWQLLAGGASTDKTDERGLFSTLLHKAAAAGQQGVVQELLAAGADLSATTPGFLEPRRFHSVALGSHKWPPRCRAAARINRCQLGSHSHP